MDLINEARSIIGEQIEALKLLQNYVDDNFMHIVNKVVNNSGKLIFTGIGKPGHVCKKLAATFSSLGFPSYYLHPSDALHGDLGIVSSSDIVIAISYSGESNEVINLIPSLKMIGATIIAISKNLDSTLVKNADLFQILPDITEACHLGLAPTTSTTMEMVYGDTLAIIASKFRGFSKESFAIFHPAGSLGKKLLLKASNIMKKDIDIPKVYKNATFKDLIIEMTQKGLGLVNIVDKENRLLGVITDGDIRRLFEKNNFKVEGNVCEYMTVNPKTIKEDILAIDALKFMKQYNITCIPIVDSNNVLVGTLKLMHIIDEGVVI